MREEIRSRLDTARDTFAGKDPGGAMARLSSIYKAASPDDRAVMNEIIREWLQSDDESDRFDGAFLTVEFSIRENLDLIRRLRDEAENRTDPGAPYAGAQYDRIAGRLIEERSDGDAG